MFNRIAAMRAGQLSCLSWDLGGEKHLASMGMRLPEANRPNPNPYTEWSPDRVNEIRPRFPEPYYTFSETFSY